MQIRNGDLPLHVELDGEEGARPVLLLHGITASVRTWDWLVPHLADRYRLVRLDFRGHGRSGRTPGAYQPEGYVSDAAAVCRELAGDPCIVIGHSLGGMTAAALAQRHPDLVRAMVLEDPPLGAVRRLEGNTLMDGFRLMRESIPRLQDKGVPVDALASSLAKAPSAVGTPFGELLHPDALTTMAAAMLEVDATVLDPVLDGTNVAAFDPETPIGVPTLVLTADPTSPDAVARPDDVGRVCAASPQVAVQVMAGASHLIHDELAQRDAFLEAVTAFLARHG